MPSVSFFFCYLFLYLLLLLEKYINGLAFRLVVVVSIAKVDLEKTKMQKNDLSVSPLLQKLEEWFDNQNFRSEPMHYIAM